MEEIKDRFTQIINENRISQKLFAEHQGTSQSAVSRVFNEISTTTKVGYFITLYELTGVNINWLLTGMGEKYVQKVPANVQHDPSLDVEENVRYNTLLSEYQAIVKDLVARNKKQEENIEELLKLVKDANKL